MALIDCLLTIEALNGLARIAVGGATGSVSPGSSGGVRWNRSTPAALVAPRASENELARNWISISLSVAVSPAGMSKLPVKE